MSVFRSTLNRGASGLLALTLLTPSITYGEPKLLDPAAVHLRILKQGLDHWTGIEERNGLRLFGRVIFIGDNSLTLQLPNDPEPIDIPYSDVAYLCGGFTTRDKVLVISSVAAVGGLAAWGIVHAHNLSNKPLVPPTPPAPPFP